MSARSAIRRAVRVLTGEAHWPHLERQVLEVRDLACLKRALGWDKDPVLEREELLVFENVTHLNDRRLRDAEVIGAACCNGDPEIVLEIGTAHGRATVLMASNAPDARIYTVNLPPEQAGEGGRLITLAPERDEIGAEFLTRGLANVTQILANTKDWRPDFGPIDLALIDGCHDAEFVYRDTQRVLERCEPGSLILWHDFHPGLARVHPWIADVLTGVERLYRDGLLRGPILHLADSWVGLYRVPL